MREPLIQVYIKEDRKLLERLVISSFFGNEVHIQKDKSNKEHHKEQNSLLIFANCTTNRKSLLCNNHYNPVNSKIIFNNSFVLQSLKHNGSH